jgi:GR25 family glycosyltransferase involved in LPS biosynthesis
MQLNNFQFVNAVDFREIDFTSELNPFRPTFGCLMSHYKIFKFCLDNNLKEVMVFEDDFSHDGNYREKINQYISEIPDAYDIVLFGNNIQGVKEFSENILKIEGPFWGTYAYIINENLMIKFVNFIEENDLFSNLIHSDNVLSYLCFCNNLNVFHPKSNLIKHMPFYSNNQHDDFFGFHIPKEMKQKMLNLTKNHQLF